MGWVFADAWEAIAGVQPNQAAFIQGDRVVSWGDFDARADALAAGLLDFDVSHNAKVAAWLYNGPEYLETYFAAFKAGLEPFNTNYRYGPDEIIYLFDNADTEIVIFHAAFVEVAEQIRHRLPKVKAWIAVGEPGYPAPDWASDYDTIVADIPEKRPVRASWGRSGEDLVLLYTGGTTGMPKGVMWRQDDLFEALGAGASPERSLGPTASIAALVGRIGESEHVRPRNLIAAPLMHGTGQFVSMIALINGGTVILLPSRKFDAAELWSEVERLQATSILLVGLAFSTPMLEALEAAPGRWDLSSVKGMTSSGSMWSQENKRGLLKHIPGATIRDGLSSSEAAGLGASISAAGEIAETASFVPGPNTAVFTEDGRRVAPGSGERGLIAVTGHQPVGYYKDPEKWAQTFRNYEGKRWSVPGDWAEVNVDGTLKLLGRGSVCINTGGEKVFPEEVEEALKRHASVRDAVVIGAPDPLFGERICAVVEPETGHEPNLSDLARHVRGELAAYKVPRNLVIVTSIARGPNGKVDYKGVKAHAMARLGIKTA